jgi:hypothetical protein
MSNKLKKALIKSASQVRVRSFSAQPQRSHIVTKNSLKKTRNYELATQITLRLRREGSKVRRTIRNRPAFSAFFSKGLFSEARLRITS